VERAAESVLGDETEALRLAKRELDNLSQDIERELSQNAQRQSALGSATNNASTNLVRQMAAGSSTNQTRGTSSTNSPSSGQASANAPTNTADRSGSQREGELASGEQSIQSSPPSSQNGNPGGANPSERSSSQMAANNSSAQGNPGQRAGENTNANNNNRGQGQRNASSQAAAGGGREPMDPEGGPASGGGEGRGSGPLTGEDYVEWSDRLRDVEEMLEIPDLRTEVARIRDRARAVRMEYKKLQKKPDWAVVRTQIAAPLAEIRSRVSEELARRQSPDNLVPIDRDPVPNKYSELVRRYYEKLGKSE